MEKFRFCDIMSQEDVMEEINIYCDESCHLDYSSNEVMGLGGIECPVAKIKEVGRNLKEIKRHFGIPEHQELKWSKISPSNLELYKGFINYFFIDDDLRFRGTIIKNKSRLRFTKKNTKSDFYYKMLYYIIIKRINPENRYNIYLDIKDTNSAKKIQTLKRYLNQTKLDCNVSEVVKSIQTIRSYESNILQLTDIILGAIVHLNNGYSESKAKAELISYIKEKSEKSLIRSTLLSEPKLNVFFSDADRMRLRGEDDL